MAETSYTQKAFLGGEWSPYFQGRTDHPKYVTALNVCRNGLPIEEGTWLRRPGSRLKAPTYQNKPGRLYPVEFVTSQPYDVEFTEGWVRFYQGHNLVGTTDGPLAVTSISSANPAVLTLTNPATWDTDDEIRFTFDAAHPTGSLPLRQRTFLVTKLTTSTFSLRDGLTLASIDGSTLGIAGGTVITASRILRIATPYVSGRWANSRIVQNQDFGIVLNGDYPPQVLTITTGTIAGTADATLAPLTMIDGPYLDPVVDSSGIGSVLNWTGGTIAGPSIADSETGGPGHSKGDIVAVKFFNTATTHSPQYVFMVYKGGVITPGNQPGENYSLGEPSGFDSFGVRLEITSTSGWAPVDPTSVGSQATGVFTIAAIFQQWKAIQYYIVNNCVSTGGTSYKCILGNVGIQPGVTGGWATYWEAIDSGVAVTGLGKTPVGFQTTDVGRLIRMLSAPPDYDPTVLYNTGCLVTFQGQTYVHTGEPWSNFGNAETFNSNLTGNATAAVSPTSFTPTAWGIPAINTMVQSETQVSDPFYSSATLKPGWAPVLNATNWIWGVITNVLSSSVAEVTLDAGSPPMLSPLSNFQINTWRLGAYSDTTGYPTCGSFYEGRFWFGGAVKNRFDTSQTNGWVPGNTVLNMAPTLTTGDILSGRSNDGTVTDACGISYTLESRDKNDIFWLEPDHSGIVAGTFGGEWAIQASTLSDPITPTSIQAKRVTKYGCANIEPRRTGISLVFIQKFQRRIMEFLSDVFTGRYIAPHLNEAAKHLTTGGVAEIGYQEELAPILWARTGGGLVKVTSIVDEIISNCTFDPLFTSMLATLSNGDLTLDGNVTWWGMAVAIDLDAKLIWFYNPWNDSWNGTARTGNDPGTGVGGYDYSTASPAMSGTIYPAMTCSDGDSITTNFGATAFAYKKPAGFSAWGATCTWNPADKDASIFLSGGNLTVTGNGTTVFNTGMVRGTVGATSGKLYYEFTFNTKGSTATGVVYGVADGTADTGVFVADHGNGAAMSSNGDAWYLPTKFATIFSFGYVPYTGNPTSMPRTTLGTLGHSTGKWYWELSIDLMTATASKAIAIGIANRLSRLAHVTGNAGTALGDSIYGLAFLNTSEIRFSNSVLGTSGPTFGQGVTLGLAVDIDAALAWIFDPSTGKWNDDILANQNPATGTGGISFSGMPTPIYPAAEIYFWLLVDQVTGNFMGPFSNTIPTGFLPWGTAVITPVETTTYTISPGDLIGATYRRVSAFTTEAPAFVGWHRHDLGHTRQPTSIAVGPTGDGTLDNLDMVTTDGTNYYVEGLTQIFDEDDLLVNSWFVDGGLVPDSAYADTVSSVTGIRFAGLNWLIGKTVAVCAFGLDLGDYLVDANGTVFVPYGNGVAPAAFDYTIAGAGHYLFTAAYITANLLTIDTRNGAVPYGGKFMPCCVGYTYTSQGQMLRPATPETGGSRAGPTMGKKRRSHLFTGLFHNTIGVQVGTDFANKLLPANFKNDGDVLTPPDQMYSGTWRDTVIDDYDFDSMITWQILRPYPASVVSIGAMIKTQDV